MKLRPNGSRRKRLRNIIFRRDGYVCFYCGLHADSEKERKALTLDHVIPLSAGGSDLEGESNNGM